MDIQKIIDTKIPDVAPVYGEYAEGLSHPSIMLMPGRL